MTKRLLIVTAVAMLVWGLQGTPATAADNPQDDRRATIDRIIYGSDHWAKYREITYWGIADLSVSDYKPGSGDARRLGLVRQDVVAGRPFPREYPSTRLQQAFRKEFTRFFGDLPFRDLNEGRDARWDQFYKEHEGKFRTMNRELEIRELRDKWSALEEARRRSLYGGRAGALYCDVAVKRAAFPILYEMRCSMSAEDDLFDKGTYSGSEGEDFRRDIGFSSVDHVAGEIEKGLSAMLEYLSSALTKMRKYGPQSR